MNPTNPTNENETDKPDATDKDNNDDDDDDDDDKDDGDDDNAPDPSQILLDLHGEKFKSQTKTWKTIPDNVKQQAKALIFIEYEHLDRIMEDIDHLHVVTTANFTKDEWIHLFLEIKAVPPRSKHRFIRIMAISLALLDPYALFPDTLKDHVLYDSTISRAWVAAYTLYGAAWLDETENIDLGKPNPPTALWLSLDPAIIHKELPFETYDIYADDPQSLHNLEISMKKWLKMPTQKAPLEPEEWAKAMQQNFTTPKVRKVCIQLAITPLTPFKELKLMEDNELAKISLTTLWAGTRMLLGDVNRNVAVEAANEPDVGKKHINLTSTSKPSPSSKPTPPKSPTFAPDTKAERKPGTTLFLRCAKPSVLQPILHKSKRKFTGFWKLKLPSATESFGSKGIEEVLAHLGNFMDIACAIDKKLEIRGWNEELDIKPYNKGSASLFRIPYIEGSVAEIRHQYFYSQGRKYLVAFSFVTRRAQGRIFGLDHLR